MSGLILKDILSTRKHYFSNMKITIILLAFFVMFALSTVYGNFAPMEGFEDDALDFRVFIVMMFFIPLFNISVPFISIQNDRQSGFREFELTFPISDGRKVAAKYITALFYLSLSIIYLIVPYLSYSFAGYEWDVKFLYAYLLVMEFAALYILLLIPLTLFFDNFKKTQMIVNFSIIILGTAIGIWGTVNINGNAWNVGGFIESVWNYYMGAAVLILLLVLAVCYIISYHFALKAYALKRGETA